MVSPWAPQASARTTCRVPLVWFFLERDIRQCSRPRPVFDKALSSSNDTGPTATTGFNNGFPSYNSIPSSDNRFPRKSWY